MRRRLALCGAALFGATLWAAIPASDTFTRANGALGSDWTAASVCTLSIVSTAVRGTADGFCLAKWSTATDPFPDDQCSQLTIMTTTNADAISVGVRGSGVLGTNFSGYLFTTDGPRDSTVEKIVAEVRSDIHALPAERFTVGDIIKLCVQGTTLTAFRNGAPLSTDTDSAIAIGQPWMAIFDASQGGVGNASLDNWSGTEPLAVSGTVRRATTMGVGE